jgi:hypothetical protein
MKAEVTNIIEELFGIILVTARLSSYVFFTFSVTNITPGTPKEIALSLRTYPRVTHYHSTVIDQQ